MAVMVAKEGKAAMGRPAAKVAMGSNLGSGAMVAPVERVDLAAKEVGLATVLRVETCLRRAFQFSRRAPFLHPEDWQVCQG